jgi:uncharacterized protein YdeI (YjbR/CyaY-like superfamily)
MKKTAAKSFQAVLERESSGLGWTIIRIPFDAKKVWGTRGRVKVKGDINGFAFRTSFFPDGKGGYTLLVNRKMQSGAGVVAGMAAKFRLEPDTAERSVAVPAELEEFLAEDRALRVWYDKLTYSIRKYLVALITDVKNAGTRARRAEQIAELLLATMEAERELPPILQAAFARDGRAREGWSLMSATQRRGHLLGIFYYRNPESRGRRAAKAVQNAVEIAEKKQKAPKSK